MRKEKTPQESKIEKKHMDFDAVPSQEELKKKKERELKEREDRIDEAGEESFPASDPPAIH